MRLTADTNVMVAALLWNGRPRQLIQLARANKIELFTSQALLDELKNVLSRRKFAEKITASLLTVDQLVDLYSGFARVVWPAPLARIAPDPDDDVVIGTAISATADFVVTGDRALLSVNSYQRVRIISVDEALQTLAMP